MCMFSFLPVFLVVFRALRDLSVEFLLKTDSGYPRDAEDSLFTLATPEHSLRFKVGLGISRTNALGISRTNADSQWNPVYNVFHRNFCCGNETIRRLFCKRDLDAANLRPALEQSCGKQTPNDRKLFFRANLLYVPGIKM